MQDQNPGNIAFKFKARGVVGVILTDTIYGLAARANDEDAVAKLYRLKSRENKPGTLIASSIDQLTQLGIKRRYLSAVRDFWPSRISVIIPAPPELNYLHQGKNTLAMRVVADSRLVEILKLTGPLITSSANLPGEKPAQNIKQAKKYFNHHVNFYSDDGEVIDNTPSTIIRIIDDAIDVVRQGAEKIN